MHLIFIRHTSVDIPAGICYGQSDVPLKITFKEEAQAVRKRLKSLPIDFAYTSPLSRCTLLAQVCGFAHARQDSRLLELNFGRWEMKAWEDIDMSIWKQDWIHPSTPQGESFYEMYERVSEFLLEMEKLHDKHTVAIFTHSGVINCAKVYFNLCNMTSAFDSSTPYGGILEISQ